MILEVSAQAALESLAASVPVKDWQSSGTTPQRDEACMTVLVGSIGLSAYEVELDGAKWVAVVTEKGYDVEGNWDDTSFYANEVSKALANGATPIQMLDSVYVIAEA